MAKNTILGIILLVVVLGLGAYGYTYYVPEKFPQIPDSVSSDVNDSNVRAAVEEYAKTLGTNRVEIVSIAPRADGAAFHSYQVEANMVIMQQPQGTAGGVPVGVQPLSLTVEKQAAGWVVTAVSKGAYSELPQQVTVTGLWECLPHKDRTGPQTMECAFGIAKDQSDGHYAIDTSLMSVYPVDYPTGTHLRVTGILTPVEQLSSIQKYDIDGVIRATTITKI